MQNIFLVGLRGCGKTTLGKTLSQNLQCQFYDCDDLIYKKFGKSIAKIVEDKGWSYFRAEESQILKQIQGNNAIIATGGGIVLAKENRKYIKENGLAIFLNPPLDELIIRLGQNPLKDQRPSFQVESLENEVNRLYAERLELYLEVADFQVDTSKEIGQNVAEIITFLKSKG